MTAISASNEGEPRTTSKPTEPGLTPEKNRPEAIVRELITRGFNGGDLSVLDEVLDSAYVEHEVLAPDVPPTGAAVREIIVSLRTGFPDLYLAIEEIDTVNDRVWFRMRATGTHLGPFLGSPPTGRKLSVDVMDLVKIRNGRIVEHWGVPDNLSAMAQLGLLPSD
jgi:predicted ester cyclase